MLIRNLLFATLFTFLAVPAQAGGMNRLVLNQMLQAMNEVQTLKFNLTKEERINGQLVTKSLRVKYRKHPFAIYLYFYDPNPGMEVLYVSGLNDGKAWINPNKALLSWLEPKMDPLGKGMGKKEHHTLFEMGMEYTRMLLTELQDRADREGRFDALCQFDGVVDVGNRKCQKIALLYPDFAYTPYKVLDGEDIRSIARKLNLNPYMILEKNRIAWFDKVRTGDEILIPNIFAPKVYLYVDKITRLPILQEIFDEKGLFERYRYEYLLVNPEISEEEFRPDFPQYGF